MLRAGLFTFFLMWAVSPSVSIAADRWALLIGVDKCKALGELKVCANDARALKDVLLKVGYSEARTVLLTDDTQDLAKWPTIGNIERSIESIARVASKDDTILVFFSGHGVTRGNEGYLVPTDGDTTRGVALSWVRAQLEESRAGQKALILDACHSGAAKGVNGIAPSLAVSKNLVMLLSSAADQVSWPDETAGHSVFSQFLIEGLSGKAAGPDRKVTHAELFKYIETRVRAWTFKQQKPLQTPLLVADPQYAMVIGECPEKDVIVEKPKPPQPAELPKNLSLDCGNGVSMELVLIPAGEFMMGSEDGSNDEKPVHKVRITTPFYMGKCEVTQAQYDAVMGNNPAYFKGPKNPVEQVSWNDAVEFCKKLSQRSGQIVRLPTEAEWEYACRAGTRTRFCNGDSENGLGTVAWYNSNSVGKTHAVGEKRPNAWGLYDMHGNVWEWCADWYDEDYYRNSPASDPAGPANGKYRVLRGGSWNNKPRNCRSANRNRNNPTNTNNNNGFRICVVLQQFLWMCGRILGRKAGAYGCPSSAERTPGSAPGSVYAEPKIEKLGRGWYFETAERECRGRAGLFV